MRTYTVTWRDTVVRPQGPLIADIRAGVFQSSFVEHNDQKAKSMGRALMACEGIEDVTVTRTDEVDVPVDIPMVPPVPVPHHSHGPVDHLGG